MSQLFSPQFVRYLNQNEARLKVNQSGELQHCSTQLKIIILSFIIFHQLFYFHCVYHKSKKMMLGNYEKKVGNC